MARAAKVRQLHAGRDGGQPTSGFLAYPSQPQEVAAELRATWRRAPAADDRYTLTSWETIDNAGRPMVEEILAAIERADFVCADITVINANVLFEAGFAIGCRKRLFPLRYSPYAGPQLDADGWRELGLFDTLGVVFYDSAQALCDRLDGMGDYRPLEYSDGLDARSRVWVLNLPVANEAQVRLTASVKKEFIGFHSFDQAEDVRLSAREAIDAVAKSSGAILPWLPASIRGHVVHNARLAFCLGLAKGMGRRALVLVPKGEQIPLDFRDGVSFYSSPADIRDAVARFRRDVDEAFHAGSEALSALPFLARISFGSKVAENEFRDLHQYYVATDQYERTLRGEANLVVGRKGAGKSALFFRVRDQLRRHRQNVVVDLRPEGYQLQKLKDRVLKFLEHGSKTQIVTAFWHYLLLTEMAITALDKDRGAAGRDPALAQAQTELAAAVGRAATWQDEADFSERLAELADRVIERFERSAGPALDEAAPRPLATGQIIEIVYGTEVRALQDALGRYLVLKEQAWLLFDNIDKGWSPGGVSAEDMAIVSALIDAARKIERDLKRRDCEFSSAIFLRSDVLDLLIQQLPDRGKDSKVSVDWHDESLLREVVRKRLSFSMGKPGEAFDVLWGRIAEPNAFGQDSFSYAVARSLYRPRFLIALLDHAKSFAVNLGKPKLDQECFEKGMKVFSSDLVTDISREISDIVPDGLSVLYGFVDDASELLEDRLRETLGRQGIPGEAHERIIELLMYFGVLGVLDQEGARATFIYDVSYNMDTLKALARKAWRSNALFQVHPALWPALRMRSDLLGDGLPGL